VTNATADLTRINDPEARNTWQYTRDGALFGQTVRVPGSDLDSDGSSDREETYLVTASGAYVYGWMADENGEFSETNNLASLTPIVYATGVAYSDAEGSRELNDPALPPSIIPAKPTTRMSLQANVSAADSGRQNVAIPYVDQLGNSRSLVIGFNAEMGQRWTLDMSATGANNQPVPVVFQTNDNTDQTAIEFDNRGGLLRDEGGQFISPLDGIVIVEINEPGLDPQTIELDLSEITSFADDGRLTVNNSDHDGYIAGSLQNTYFNSHGVMIGSYSNGEVRNLYKLPIATFLSERNLDARPGNVFAQTAESGALKLSGLGTPTGTTHIVTGALESSNVDLADQFSKMIVTQRAYSSAAKVLSTADEMTMAARDLKR
jgi:flagellar hook protein FlgE